MKFADAFRNEVEDVTVFIFDENNKFIYSKTESGDSLKNKNYQMEIDLQPGVYSLVAWAGISQESFKSTAPVAGETDITEFRVKMNEFNSENYTSNKLLTSLWNGNISNLFVGYEYKDVEISLTKNTNQIRVILAQTGNEPTTSGDFHFQLNSKLYDFGFDNNTITENNLIYFPYLKGEKLVGDTLQSKYVFAEFSTSRLISSSGDRLIISNTKTNENIIDIPIIDYLLAGELEGYKEKMTNQEYLDRQDVYSIIFFIDQKHTWIKTQIIVNGWTVRFNNGGF